MTALIPHLPDRDRRRLISTCGLLASDKDGEVVAAVRAACRLLKPHDLTIAGLVVIALTPRPSPWRESRCPEPVRSDGRRLARLCLSMSEYLNGWEISFCRDIASGRGPLTPKQAAKLGAIEAKIDAVRS